MKLSRVIAGAILAGIIALPALAQTAPGPARAATVNGKSIPKAFLDFVVKQQAAQGAPDNEQTRKALLERLINIELVVQEADRRGLTRRAEFKTQLELARQQVIFQAYLQDHFKTHPIKEDAVRAEYDKVRSQRGEREYKARHILVEKEADAKEIVEQLKRGAKFEDLAKQSMDIGSKERGGELNWAPASTYVKPFGDALARLGKGQTTDAPVQSPFGFHVIRLDDVRQTQFPAYDEVKQQIISALQNQEVDRVVKGLRDKAKVE